MDAGRDPFNAGMKYFEKAKGLWEDGQPEKALDELEKSLEQFKKAGQDTRDLEAGVLNSMGHLRVSLGQFPRALESFSLAAGLYLKLDDKLNQAFQLQNMGSVHRDTGQWDKALEKYALARDLFEEINRPVETADQYTNMGHALAMMKNRGKALDNYEKALVIYNRYGEEQKKDLVAENIDILKFDWE